MICQEATNSRIFESIKQGASLIRIFHFKDTTTGDPIDLTGYRVRMQFRYGSASGNLVVDASTENGYFVVNHNNELGSVLLNIPASITKDWLPNKIVYECDLIYPTITFPEGRIDTIFEGSCRILENITREDDTTTPPVIVYSANFSLVQNSMYLPLIF